MLHIINYIIKIAIIVIGILFICGIGVPAKSDVDIFRIMGVVCVLFGIYRVVIYRMKIKQYNFSINDEDADNNNFSDTSNDKNSNDKN